MSGPVQVGTGTIMTIGHQAALNIQAVLKAKGIAVGAEAIEAAIRDEINMMSSHFSLAVAEAQDHFEAEVLKVKKSVAGIVAAVAQNKIVVGGIAVAVFVLGVAVGHLV